MIDIYIYIIGSVVVVSLISLVGILTLSLNEKLLHKSLFVLVSLAAGTLFGGAIIHLIPESFAKMDNTALVSFFILAGIMAFFLLEKFMKWRHVHDVGDDDDDNTHTERPGQIKPMGHLVLVSDAVHNLIDGIIIATSYVISIELGIATTIAIAIHEIPQEISDFGVLIHAGYSKAKALIVNFISALAAIIGAVAVIIAGPSIEATIPMIAAFAAGSFLYIAGSDLVPEIHKTSHPGRSLIQFLAILFGIFIMFLLLKI